MLARNSTRVSVSASHVERDAAPITAAKLLLNSLVDYDLHVTAMDTRLACVPRGTRVLDHVAREFPPSNYLGPSVSLDPRPREVFELLLAGLCPGEIAQLLGITQHGVRYHIRTIIEAYDTDSYKNAIAIAKGQGLKGPSTES